jgi:diaminopimelate decarboxylase
LITGSEPSRQLDECLNIRDGRLFVEGCDAAGLVHRFGSPLYVLSEPQLRRNVRRYREAFAAHWPVGPVRVLPAIKANPCLAARCVLSDEGAGCDAFGEAELRAALAGRTDPALISVNGSFKDDALVRTAVELGARITVDSGYELELAERAAAELGRLALVRLRVRPWVGIEDLESDLHRGFSIATALHAAKFGVPEPELLEVGRRAVASRHVDLVGLHFHSGRHTAELRLWEEIGRAYAACTARLSRAWGGWTPREIDCGGGFPTERDPLRRRSPDQRDRPPAPPLEAYADALATSLLDGLRGHGLDPDGIALEVEPGRGIYGDAGVHLTTVRLVKAVGERLPWRWIGVDTSALFLTDTTGSEAWFEPIVCEQVDAPPTQVADIVGITCLSDRIAPDARLPAVRPGDVIAFLETGAYQESRAPNFNALPRPATVLVNGEDAELVKRADTADEVFARDVVPARLLAARAHG